MYSTLRKRFTHLFFLMAVVVNLRLMSRVIVVVRTVPLPEVIMIMNFGRTAVRVFMDVFVKVVMGMRVRVFVSVFLASVRMLVLVLMGVFMPMYVFVLVLSFHGSAPFGGLSTSVRPRQWIFVFFDPFPLARGPSVGDARILNGLFRIGSR